MTSFPVRTNIQGLLANPPPMGADPNYDTVIVGAGCSGLYSAYRLLNNPTTANQKIGMFDMLDRIAGRLWSIKFEGSNTPMELGGMRYIENHHKLLTHYIKELKMSSIPFDMSGNPMQNYILHAYLRNDRYRQN